MDPLTAVATITGLVGLAVQAGVGLSRLIASVKDAPEDLQQLRRETTALHAALQHLQQTFDASSNSYIQPQLTTLEQVTLNTQRTLMNLTSDVSKLIKARSFWKKLQLRPVIDSNLVRRYRDALSMEINMLNLMISSLGEYDILCGCEQCFTDRFRQLDGDKPILRHYFEKSSSSWSK